MKVILVLLMCCSVLVSCKDKPQIRIEKPQPFLSMQVDEFLLPASSSTMNMVTEWYIRNSLQTITNNLCIPHLTIYSITNAAKDRNDHSNLWNIIVGIESASNLDTPDLKRLANILVQISFVKMVSNGEFQVYKPRK